jgi:pilus assembly protein Flp/PilA
MQQYQSRLCSYAKLIKELWRDESGQDLIEYALVAALIALAATAGMSAVATQISSAFTSIATKFNGYTS